MTGSGKTLAVQEQFSKVTGLHTASPQYKTNLQQAVSSEQTVELDTADRFWVASRVPNFFPVSARIRRILAVRKLLGMPHLYYIYNARERRNYTAGRKQQIGDYQPYRMSEDDEAEELSAGEGPRKHAGVAWLNGRVFRKSNFSAAKALAWLIPSPEKMNGESDSWYAFWLFAVMLVGTLLIVDSSVGWWALAVAGVLMVVTCALSMFTIQNEDVRTMIDRVVDGDIEFSKSEQHLLHVARKSRDQISSSYAYKTHYLQELHLGINVEDAQALILRHLLTLTKMRAKIKAKTANRFEKEIFQQSWSELLHCVAALQEYADTVDRLSDALQENEGESRGYGSDVDGDELVKHTVLSEMTSADLQASRQTAEAVTEQLRRMATPI